MKKSTKLISIILSCLLLIGAAVGITVAADEATEGAPISIEGFNLSYEGAVKVAYYVSNRELAEGESVVLFTSAENFENIPYEAKDAEGYDVCAEFDTVTVGDIAYSVFYSEGAKTAELRRDIYAVAAIVDASGAVVAHTEVEAYSPYAYAMNRFDGEYTEDQAELYTALLDYGAAVQKVVFSDADGVLDEVALAAAGGWADAYYVVSETVTLDGETKTSATTEYRGADYADAYAPEIGKWYGENKNQILIGISNAEGNSFFGEKYADNWNKISFGPGHNAYSANYATSAGKYVTYAGAVANVPDGVKGTVDHYGDEYYLGSVSDTYLSYVDSKDATLTTAADANGYKYTYVARGQAYVNADGKLTYERSATVLKVTKDDVEVDTSAADYQGQWKVGEIINNTSLAKMGSMVNSLQLSTTTTPDVAFSTLRHVYETDIAVEATKAGGSGHIGQFWLSVEGTNAASNYIWGVDVNATENSYGFSVATPTNLSENKVTYQSNTIEETSTIVSGLKYGQTYNLRVETYSDVYGEGTVLVRFYLDGKLAHTYINTYNYNMNGNVDATMGCVRFGIPSNGRDCHFYLDNTYVASDYVVDDYLGRGKYNDVFGTEDFESGDTDKVYLRGTQGTAATRFENTDFLTDSRYMGYVFAQEEGNTFLKYAVKNTTDNSDANVTPLIYSDNKVGDTYVFATDFRWDGAAEAAQDPAPEGDAAKNWSATPWYLRFGFRSVGSTRGSDDTIFYVYGISKQGAAAGEPVEGESADDLYLSTSSNLNDAKVRPFAVLERGMWYNIRMEYVPTSCVKNADDKYVSKGILTIYINGEIVYEEAVTSKPRANTNNLTFDHVYIQGRGARNADGYGVRDYAYCLDNTYCDALSKNYNNDATADELAGSFYSAALTYDGITELAEENAGFKLTGSSMSYNESVLMNIKDGVVKTSQGLKNWARIASEGDNKVLELGSQRQQDVAIDWINGGETTGDSYVFSTGIKWLGSGVISSILTNKERYDDTWLVKLGLMSSASGDRDSYMLPIFGWRNADDNLELRLGMGMSAPVIAVIEAGQWYDLNVSYVPTKNGNDFCGDVVVTLNGQVVYEDTYTGKGSIDNSDYVGAFIQYRAIARDVVMRFDNTYAGTISDYKIGGGVNAEDAIKFDGEGEFTSNNIEGNTISVKADGENNVLYLEKQAESTTNNKALAIFNYAPSTAAATSYVYELDMKLLTEGLAMPEKQEGTWTAKLAVRNKLGKEMDQLVFTPVKDENGAITEFAISVDTTTEVLGYISADEWHNIRIVYTPIDYQNAEKVIIVDGMTVILGAENSVEGTKATDDKTSFGSASFELRGWATYVAAEVDNVYLGTIDGKTATTPDVNGYDGETPNMPINLGSTGLAVKTEENNAYLNVIKSNKSPTNGESKIFFTPESADTFVAPAFGTAYVFEAKMRINEFINASGDNAGSDWILALGFTDDIVNDNDKNTVSVNILENKATDGVYDAKDATFMKKPVSELDVTEWMDVKMEMIVGEVAANGNVTVTIFYYINGEQCATTSNSVNLQAFNGIKAVKLKTKSFGTSAGKPASLDMDVDDVKLYSYYTGEATDAATGKLSFDFENGSTGFIGNTVALSGANDDAWTAAHTQIKTEGDNSYLNVFADRETNVSAAANLLFNDVNNALLDAQVGSTYEISFRIRLNKLLNDVGNTSGTLPFGTTWAFYAGVACTNNGSFANDKATACLTFSTTRVSADKEQGTSGVTNFDLGMGEWAEITFIYEATAVTETTITLKTSIVVNGVIVGHYNSSGTATGRASTQDNDFTDKNVTYTKGDVSAFCIRLNGVDTSKSNGRLYSYDIDIDDIELKAYNTK